LLEHINVGTTILEILGVVKVGRKIIKRRTFCFVKLINFTKSNLIGQITKTPL